MLEPPPGGPPNQKFSFLPRDLPDLTPNPNSGVPRKLWQSTGPRPTNGENHQEGKANHAKPCFFPRDFLTLSFESTQEPLRFLASRPSLTNQLETQTKATKATNVKPFFFARTSRALSPPFQVPSGFPDGSPGPIQADPMATQLETGKPERAGPMVKPVLIFPAPELPWTLKAPAIPLQEAPTVCWPQDNP